MRLLLTGHKKLALKRDNDYGPITDGEVLLEVLCCGICRTDAKMWAEGHRDLILPRVPGHEIVAADRHGQRYVIWPGDACGECCYCRTGRENLCRQINIIGFHRDGGFAEKIIVPEASLIPVPETLGTVVACLAEPAGCVMHALASCRLGKNARVIILGGGTLGILAAIAASESGADPLIIEKNPFKIKAIEQILGKSGIACVQDAGKTEADVVINTCSVPDAFSQGLGLLVRGGHFCFFSGLTGNMEIDIDLMNLIHYREITVAGAYGLIRADMQRAVCFMETCSPILERLIADIVGPEEVPALMTRVLSGVGFKYVLNIAGI